MREKIFCPYCKKSNTSPEIVGTVKKCDQFYTAIPKLGLGLMGEMILKAPKNSVEYTQVSYHCSDCGVTFDSADNLGAELQSATTSLKRGIISLLLWVALVVILVIALVTKNTALSVAGLFLCGLSCLVLYVPIQIAFCSTNTFVNVGMYALTALVLVSIVVRIIFIIIKAVRQIREKKAALGQFRAVNNERALTDC